jgi:uncharacterized membrane protein YidH (DUF202 family)
MFAPSTSDQGSSKNPSILSSATAGFYSIIVGALVLVAGLAWNEAFQSLFQRYFRAGDAVLARFIYALIITTIVVVVVIIFARIFQQQPKFR